MTATTLTRPPLSPAARVLLDRSRAGLLHAAAARTCSERYLAAHMAALRAAAAVLAVRGPSRLPRRAAQRVGGAAPARSRDGGVGRRSSRPPPRGGPRSRPAAATRSPLARPTTCSATPRPFHHLVEASFGLPAPAGPAAAPSRPATDCPADGPPCPSRTCTSPRGTRCGTALDARRRWSERAAAQGMDTLALTDRDGLYGAVKFVLACRTAGIAPVLGVGPRRRAHRPARPGCRRGPIPRRGRGRARRTPVRGGATVDLRHPRVTVLALGADQAAGRPAGVGWARLCRLVSRPTCAASAACRSPT